MQEKIRKAWLVAKSIAKALVFLILYSFKEFKLP